MSNGTLHKLRARWETFAEKHPRMRVYGEKLMNYARNGMMRDSEVVEFNTHFTGRMTRQTFWLTVIGLVFIALAAQWLVRLALGLSALTLSYIGLMLSRVLGGWLPDVLHGFYVVCACLGYALLFIFFAWLAVVAASAAVRRLHDIGKSGWFVLIALIPGIGWLILAIMCCMESAEEDEEDVSKDDVSLNDEESAESIPQPVNPVPQQTLPSSPQVSLLPPQAISCSLCHGKGKLPNGFPCPQCGGSGKA